MKYSKGQYAQFAHVSDADAINLMEQLGYDTKVEVDTGMVNYFRHNNNGYFALSEEVVESDAGTFIKVSELPGNSMMDENTHTELTEIEFDGDNYALEGIFESDDGIYTKMSLIAQAKEELDVEDDEDIVITYEGKDYKIVDNEDEADFIMFINEDEDGEVNVVSESDEYSDKIFLVSIEEGKKPAFLDKDDDDKDDKDDKKDKKKKGKKGKKDDKDADADDEDSDADDEDSDDKPDFLKGKKFKKKGK